MTQTDLEKDRHDALVQFNSETGTIHRLQEPTQWLRLIGYRGKEAL